MRPDYLMRTVVYAPYHIGVVTVVQCSTIGKGAYVLTNHRRFTVVMLELNPAYFLCKLAEFFYQYINISYHIILLVSYTRFNVGMLANKSIFDHRIAPTECYPLDDNKYDSLLLSFLPVPCY